MCRKVRNCKPVKCKVFAFLLITLNTLVFFYYIVMQSSMFIHDYRSPLVAANHP